MASKNLYSEKDFVTVVDAAGNVLPDPVPKRWLGTDLLPAGTKQATRASLEKDEKVRKEQEAEAAAAAKAAADAAAAEAVAAAAAASAGTTKP